MEENEKAYMPKNKLQEGLMDCRLYLSEISGDLKHALATAQTKEIEDNRPQEALKEINKKIRRCKEEERKRRLINKRNKIIELVENKQRTVQKTFDVETYHSFMQTFAVVWGEYRHQVTKWYRPGEYELELPDGQKVNLPPTKEHIDMLFQAWTSQQNQPQAELALHLYQDFLASLKLSGIGDLSISELPEEKDIPFDLWGEK